MSGESRAHVRLVERLIAHVRAAHQPPRGLLLLADHATFGSDRPRRIDGYLPDLFASDLPVTFEVLGEAKTIPDLDSARSLRQIRAFLDYLSVRPGSTFYLSLPPFSAARGRAVIKQVVIPAHATVRIEVLDGF